MTATSGQRIAITGATGLVGRALSSALRTRGNDVIEISRTPTAGGLQWNPAREEFDLARLAGVDAVIHLAGESIAGARWTDERKRTLRASRIGPTRWLATLLAGLRPRPSLLISASAIGIYGSRGEELLDEASPLGDDFLARLATEWEGAADPAREAGIRVVHPRFGVILSAAGGALARLLPPFRLGLGGPIGDGKQWMSWITLEDVVGGVEHLLATAALAGPVNFTTANPLRNRDFATALGAAVHRPAVIPLPAFALRLAFGEMADGTLLASQRVLPTRLVAAGYRMRHPDIAAALTSVLSSL